MQLCPTLCVRTLSECPVQYGTGSCPSNNTLCVDGTCRKSCSKALNECSCPHNGQLDRPTDDTFVSCRRATAWMNFYDVIDENKVAGSCSSIYGVGGELLTSARSASPGATRLLLDCDASLEKISLGSVGFLCAYAVFGTFGFLLIVWKIMKRYAKWNSFTWCFVCVCFFCF